MVSAKALFYGQRVDGRGAQVEGGVCVMGTGRPVPASGLSRFRRVLNRESNVTTTGPSAPPPLPPPLQPPPPRPLARTSINVSGVGGGGGGG